MSGVWLPEKKREMALCSFLAVPERTIVLPDDSMNRSIVSKARLQYNLLPAVFIQQRPSESTRCLPVRAPPPAVYGGSRPADKHIWRIFALETPFSRGEGDRGSSLLKKAPTSRALDSRFRGNDGERDVFPNGHPRESGDPGEAGLFQRPVRSERLGANVRIPPAQRVRSTARNLPAEPSTRGAWIGNAGRTQVEASYSKEKRAGELTSWPHRLAPRRRF